MFQVQNITVMRKAGGTVFVLCSSWLNKQELRYTKTGARTQVANINLILTQTLTNELLRLSYRGVFWKEE